MKMRAREKSLHLLAHSLNGCNGWSLARSHDLPRGWQGLKDLAHLLLLLQVHLWGAGVEVEQCRFSHRPPTPAPGTLLKQTSRPIFLQDTFRPSH